MTHYKGKGEQITVPIWCAAATDGTHKILVDTGIRDINEYKKSEPGASQSADQEITTALKNIMGWSADDVDMVINTHLHCDHCGCNYKFKNAKFYIQKKEKNGKQPSIRQSRWLLSMTGPLLTRLRSTISAGSFLTEMLIYCPGSKS